MKKITVFLVGVMTTILLCACGVETEELPENDAAEKPEAISEDAIQKLTDVWKEDSSRESILLERVLSDLEEAEICYAGYYNVSGERLDVTLQDQTLLVFMEISDPEQEYWEHTNRYELMLCGEWFNDSCFQEKYLNEYDVTVDEYIWPDLSVEELDENSLYSLNQTDLSIARNQVFARHGRKFVDPLLHAVFSQKNWYQPQYEGDEFDSKAQEQFTDMEKANLALVEKNETERYFRKSGNYDTMKALLPGSSMDLDGDGRKEQILYSVQWEDAEEEFGVATLTIRGEGDRESTVEEQLVNPHAMPYLCVLEDGAYQIGMAQNGMSADYSMTFYGYEKEQIQPKSIISTYPEAVQIAGDGLWALEETYHIQCEPIYFAYKLENGSLVKQEQDYYEYRGNEVTALLEIDLYAEQDAVEPVDRLHSQDQIIVLGGDLQKWVKIERVSDGKEFWIRVENGECILPDGSSTYSGNVFDGLTFYG